VLLAAVEEVVTEVAWLLVDVSDALAGFSDAELRAVVLLVVASEVLEGVLEESAPVEGALVDAGLEVLSECVLVWAL